VYSGEKKKFFLMLKFSVSPLTQLFNGKIMQKKKEEIEVAVQFII
jgi:hypothetical protein